MTDLARLRELISMYAQRAADPFYFDATQAVYRDVAEFLRDYASLIEQLAESKEALEAAQLAFGLCLQADQEREHKRLTDSSWRHYAKQLRSLAERANKVKGE